MASSTKNTSLSDPLYNVVVREDAPFVMTKTDSMGKISYTGLAIELLEMVAEKAQFRPNIRLTDHNSYGYQDHNGKWMGLISELSDKNADLAVGAIPITTRQSAPDSVDFTKPFMSSTIGLLIKYPPSSTRGIGLMLEPFTAEVWVMIVLAFIVISLAMFLIGRFSPYEWARVSKEKDPRLARTSFSLKNSFLFAASTLSWQGYNEAPRSISGRILMCMWFMFSVFVLVAYTACLCAILTTRSDSMPQKVPFTNSEDIVENKLVKLGAMKYGHVYLTLKAGQITHNNLHTQLFKYIDNSQEWIQNRNEGIQRVKDSNGKYALIMESVTANYITATNCDLITYGEVLSTFGYGFAVPINSALMDNINLAIFSLRDEGQLTKLYNKYIVRRNICPQYDKSKLIPIKGGSSQYSPAASMDMRDMGIPFLFLFLGILGAGAALGAEFYYRKRLATKKDPDNKARQPLNTESGKTKAPTTSPPPPPIYKVNNKLQDTGKDKPKKMVAGVSEKPEAIEGKDVEKGENSIEMVSINDKVATGTDPGDVDEDAVEVDMKIDMALEDKLSSEDKTEVINEVA